MTVHLVNLTNPMMMKGPFRELLPSPPQVVHLTVPAGARVKGVRMLISGKSAEYKLTGNQVTLTVPSILDHEIVAVDLA